MNASEAKEITKKALGTEEGLKAYMESAFSMIKRAAKEGRASVYNPHGWCKEITRIQVKDLYDNLRKMGYQVDFTSDQRDGDFYEVSW